MYVWMDGCMDGCQRYISDIYIYQRIIYHVYKIIYHIQNLIYHIYEKVSAYTRCAQARAKINPSTEETRWVLSLTPSQEAVHK